MAFQCMKERLIASQIKFGLVGFWAMILMKLPNPSSGHAWLPVIQRRTVREFPIGESYPVLSFRWRTATGKRQRGFAAHHSSKVPGSESDVHYCSVDNGYFDRQ